MSSRLWSKRERQVRDWLTERDWVVIHTRPGTNFCDVVAMKIGAPTRFVEVKCTAGGPYEHFRREDRERLLGWAKLAGAEPWLAWWPPHGQLRWIHCDEWPNRHLEVAATCAECGEPVTASELERVRSDVDFVEHGDRGHLVRLEVVA